MPRRPVRRAAAAILALACWGSAAQAAGAASFTGPTPGGPALVESVASGGDGPRPAVIVLSGSKGFDSPAYAGMMRAFDEAGLDVFELHALTASDIEAIAKIGDAHARVAYEAAQLPRWTASVRDLVGRLAAEPRRAGRVGVLGISLGAEIAAAAASGSGDVRALVLVDGGPPGGTAPPSWLPPLRLIWGGADRVFSLAFAHRLLDSARTGGGRATLGVFTGGHGFFLQRGTPEAAAAWRDAAAFLARELR